MPTASRSPTTKFTWFKTTSALKLLLIELADRTGICDAVVTVSCIPPVTSRRLSRHMAKANLALESRIDRRKRRNRFALIEVAKVITEKGIDAATMLEIAELADVGAGTVYNYFASKDELAVCVLEQVMRRLANDSRQSPIPSQTLPKYMRLACEMSWKVCHHRPAMAMVVKAFGVIAGAMYRVTGPYAIRDIRRACKAGRYIVEDPELAGVKRRTR